MCGVGTCPWVLNDIDWSDKGCRGVSIPHFHPPTAAPLSCSALFCSRAFEHVAFTQAGKKENDIHHGNALIHKAPPQLHNFCFALVFIPGFFFNSQACKKKKSTPEEALKSKSDHRKGRRKSFFHYNSSLGMLYCENVHFWGSQRQGEKKREQWVRLLLSFVLTYFLSFYPKNQDPTLETEGKKITNH